MITKIVSYLFLGYLFLAFFMFVAGVTYLDYNKDIYTYLKSVDSYYVNWALEIPDIPKIPLLMQGSYYSSFDIIQLLIGIANFFVNLANGIILILNFLINLLNALIQILQLILTSIYVFNEMIVRLVADSW